MAHYQNYSDNDLVASYKETNDLVVVGELFKRYKYIVLGICLKYLNNRTSAEDALMEVFEELIISLKGAEIRQFKPWLGTVTRNYLHRRHRVENKHQVVSFEDYLQNDDDNFMELSEDMTLINEKVEVEQKEQDLRSAIQELKGEQGDCIRLFFLEGCSYTEVCERTGFTFKRVKSYIQNGKRNLKNKLEGGKG